MVKILGYVQTNSGHEEDFKMREAFGPLILQRWLLAAQFGLENRTFISDDRTVQISTKMQIQISQLNAKIQIS